MLGVLFIACVLAAVYPIVIYPLLVVLVAKLRPRPWLQGPVAEPVVHIITVHDEEDRIRQKLENAVSLKLPAGGLRTVVVDDGSTDGTQRIVEAFADRGVIWLGCPRRGKEYAQIDAIQGTTEPLLVFSDASTHLDPDAVVELIKPFADPAVSAVSGTDRLPEGRAGTGEDLYVRYEMAVRRAESLVGSLVGLSGCLFAVRREIAEGLLPNVPSDMGVALLSIQSGKRAVAQDQAMATYEATPSIETEFARKRRTAQRGMRCLWSYRGALKLKKPWTSWQVLSRKGLRFAIPLFCLAAAGILLVAAAKGQRWGSILLVGSLLAAGAGTAALRLPGLRRNRVFRALGFFVVSSAAVLVAWADVLRGQNQVSWKPTRRPGVHR